MTRRYTAKSLARYAEALQNEQRKEELLRIAREGMRHFLRERGCNV